MSVRARIFEILEVTKPGDKPSRIFDYFMITLITLNVIAVMRNVSIKVRQISFMIKLLSASDPAC